MVFPLGGNGSPSGGEPEAGLGAAVRSIAVLAPYQDLPARIKNPQVYSEYLKIWLAGLSETVGVGSETITLDGHGLMRAALAWEHNPSLFSPTTSESDEFVVRHAAVNTLLADSVADRRIGLDAAEMIRDVMYGSPAVDSLKSSAGHGVRNMELAYFELRLTRLALERGWQGVLFYDAVSNAGPEMDEAIALFQLAMGRIRLNNASGDGALLTIRQDDYAMAIELATDARARMNDYVESRHETAVMAAGLAGAAAGIGISLLPLGAPLGMTIVMASLGAGVASVATYEIIEGPSYTTTNEQTETFLAGALEGMIDAAVGGLVGAGSLAFKARQAGAVAAAAGQGVRATQATTSATSRLLGTLATGAIEGTASGTIMAVGQTALDQATWDQTTLNVMARFVRQALIGGLMGLAMGTAFSVPQSLIDALGEERARKVFEWLTQRGQTGVVGQLDEFDPTGHQAKQLLDEADDLRREGMIDDAEAKLRQIDEDVLSTPLGLTDSLLGPADRARGSARAGLEELQARGAANLSNTTVAEFLDAVSFDDLPSAQMPMRSESAAYIRLESFDPPDFRTVMDAEADMPVLREEVLHVYEVWKGPPSSRALGERLLASRLDRLWTPNGPDWSPYSNSDGLLGERLDALDAYLRLEQINQQQMLDSFPHDTTLEVSEDGFVSSDLDEDHLQAMLLIEEHSVVDLYQRTALDALLTDVDANPGRLDSYDMVFMQQFDLDEPLHLTSRTRPRPKIKRVCEARGDMTRADYDAAFADADLSTIFDLDGFQDTTLTGPRPITKQWRRRFFNPDTQETVHMVMVGGAKRFKLSEVNGQTLLAENVDRDAFFHDLPEWLDYRSDLIDHLMAGFAVTNPRGIGVGTDELANQRALAVHMVDAMGREPLGFVYGTSPLRVFAYDSQYRKLVVGADTVDGAEVFRAFAEHISTGQRHHFRPIFTLSRDHLALERFGSVDMTMAMVDLPRPVHTSIHRLYNGMERQPATGARANFNPTSMRYAALELGVHDDGIFPAMSLLESSGRMRWAQFRGSDFAPLTMTPGPEIEVPE